MEESNFVQKLKRGQRKYKGNLPFKYFNCDGVDHFAVKYTYKENNDNVDNVGKYGNDWYKSRIRTSRDLMD